MVVSVTIPDHLVLRPLELICGGNVEEFENSDEKGSKTFPSQYSLLLLFCLDCTTQPVLNVPLHTMTTF